MFRKVEEQALEVEKAQAALEAARAALQGAHQKVLQQAQRTLAYARVFADGHPELQAKLDGIQLGKKLRAASKPALGTPGVEGEGPRRRGRKPKAQVESEAQTRLEESPVEEQV